MVAFGAGTGGIGPGILAAFGTRSDVIDSEISLAENFTFYQRSHLDTAIDASVVVAYEYTLAAPVRFATRDVDVGPKRDNGRNFELCADRFQILSSLLNRVRLTREQKIDRALDRYYGQRFPRTPVEQQDSILKNDGPGHYSLSLSTWPTDLKY